MKIKNADAVKVDGKVFTENDILEVIYTDDEQDDSITAGRFCSYNEHSNEFIIDTSRMYNRKIERINAGNIISIKKVGEIDEQNNA